MSVADTKSTHTKMVSILNTPLNIPVILDTKNPPNVKYVVDDQYFAIVGFEGTENSPSNILIYNILIILLYFITISKAKKLPNTNNLQNEYNTTLNVYSSLTINNNSIQPLLVINQDIQQINDGFMKLLTDYKNEFEINTDSAQENIKLNHPLIVKLKHEYDLNLSLLRNNTSNNTSNNNDNDMKLIKNTLLPPVQGGMFKRKRKFNHSKKLHNIPKMKVNIRKTKNKR